MKKETRTASSFGACGRDPLGSSRGPYSRMHYHFSDARASDIRANDRCDENRRRRNEDRYGEHRTSRYGDRFDEPKRTRDACSDMSSRDRHRWWSPSYDDWASSSRRETRDEGYDPYEFVYGTCKQRNGTFGNEEKVKNGGDSRFSDKKSTEMKSKIYAGSEEFCLEDPYMYKKRAMRLFNEVSKRNRSSRPAEEGLKAALEEAASESDGRDTSERIFQLSS